MDLGDFPGPTARSVQETNPPRGQFWVALEITKAFAESAGNEGWQGGPQEVDEPGMVTMQVLGICAIIKTAWTKIFGPTARLFGIVNSNNWHLFKDNTFQKFRSRKNKKPIESSFENGIQTRIQTKLLGCIWLHGMAMSCDERPGPGLSLWP